MIRNIFLSHLEQLVKICQNGFLRNYKKILNGTTLEISKIKLYETATSYCEYKGDLIW